MTNERREAILGYIFVSPWIIGFAIFALYPILYSLWLSFNNVIIEPTKLATTFIGFKNYINAFTKDTAVINAFLSFLKNKLIMVFIINVFAVLFALFLSGKIKCRGFFRTLFFLPVVVVSGPVMQTLVDNKIITIPSIADFSVINLLGQTFGESVKELIVNTFSSLIHMFWFSGVQLIVYITMLQKIDGSQYEAAEIDGCSKWESFWKITLPTIKPIILVNLVYTLILLSSFDENGSVIKLIKDNMTDKGYGWATSVAWVYFLMLAVIILILAVLFLGGKDKKISILRSKEVYQYSEKRYEIKEGFFTTNKKGLRIKKTLLGKNSDGVLPKTFMYVLLSVTAFAFLYPFINMTLKSLQSPEDVLNPSIGLVPSGLYLENFTRAFKVLGFGEALLNSIYISLLPTLLQIVSCALVGYGLARFKFKGRNLILILCIAQFVIPPQILMIPTYRLYFKFKLIGSIATFLIPASLAQGLKSSIFVFLFFQFFRMIPKDYDEAAEIDGASKFQILYKVIIPLTVPVFVVGFIFSFVWYWNETYLTNLYMDGVKTLPLQLSRFAKTFENMYDPGQSAMDVSNKLNEAVHTAGTVISIVPLLLMYFVLQKWFVEGVDRSGLTGQ